MMLTDPKVDKVLNAATDFLVAAEMPVTPKLQYSALAALRGAIGENPASDLVELKHTAFLAMSRLAPHITD